MESHSDNQSTQPTCVSEVLHPSIKQCKLPSLDEKPLPASDRRSDSISLANPQNILRFCEDEGKSLFQVLQAVWAVVLRCYTGNETVCFGVLSKLVLPDNFGEAAEHVSESNIRICEISMTTNDTLPDIIKEIHASSKMTLTQYAERNPNSSRDPKLLPFDTVIAEQVPGSTVNFLATELTALAPYAIIVQVPSQIRSDSAMVNISYSCSTISNAAATNVFETVQTIIQSLLSSPLTPLSDLELPSEHDLGQLLDLNKTVTKRCDTCMHDLIKEHAIHRSNSPALQSHDGALTYGELDRVSSLVAKRLIDLGVGPEAIVPVCFEKSKWAVVAMLAIWKAGGAFVPLDPLHPVERLRSIIQRTKASLVAVSVSHSALFESGTSRVFVVGPCLINQLKEEVNDVSLGVKVRPENAAFILFTSGSTGQPKGIIQEHGSVCTNALAHGKALGMDSETRALQFAAYTFDVSMMDIFTTLVLGGCVCIPSEYDRMNNIVGFINTTQANWALLTPSFSNLIQPDDVPSLRVLSLGGEAITKENIQRWAGKVRLLNCYGPAEIGTCIISESPMNKSVRPGILGRRLESTLCWLVDPKDHNRLVPVGAVGELCVEGPTLARGYMDDPALTSASFIENPRWAKAKPGVSRRIYKVGDLLRQNSNGSFDFIGRIDSQVKIRGQRVELGEVEHHLLSEPAVAACVVACPKSGRYSNRLVGIVELKCLLPTDRPSLSSHNDGEIKVLRSNGETFDTDRLVQYMAERVTSYMVPNAWIIVEKVPVSTSFKTDRKKVIAWLTDLDHHDHGPRLSNGHNKHSSVFLSTYESIAIEISAKVAAMVAPKDEHVRSTIHHRDVLLKDTGLDSIQAISLAMHIRQVYGVKLGVENLTHKNASIRQVAEIIRKLRQGTVDTSTAAANITNEWRYNSQELKGFAASCRSRPMTVLVTGGSGFLGRQILYDLLSRPNICKVIAHVRADSVEAALKRIVLSPSTPKRWTADILSRLEIWLGDLERPKLGLDSSAWDRLFAMIAEGDKVDAIIHNGASVRWNADFETLRAVNVNSTMELLKGIIQSRCPPKLVYVSGGQALKPYEESTAEALGNVAFKNGYCQTKTVSELLVKDLMLDGEYASRLSIVKPSYMIGSPNDGTANTADFLWRLVGSCIDIHAFPSVDEDTWLYVSDIERITGVVIDNCLKPEGGIVKILDGILICDFWNILIDDFAFNLEPLDRDAWMTKVREDIGVKKEAHRLWPLLETLEEGEGAIGVPLDVRVSPSEDMTNRVRLAIRKNIEYLVGIGFLPPPPRASVQSKDINGYAQSGPGTTNGLAVDGYSAGEVTTFA